MTLTTFVAAAFVLAVNPAITAEPVVSPAVASAAIHSDSDSDSGRGRGRRGQGRDRDSDSDRRRDSDSGRRRDSDSDSDSDRDSDRRDREFLDRAGRIAQVWLDNNRDGRADRVQFYQAGKLVRVASR